MDETKEYNSLLQSVNLPRCRDRILFAGPCSAESRGQVLEAAKDIALKCPGAVFRAGVWKPRTSPESFEGIGSPALEWLAEARERYRLSVATEVATPEHVRLANDAGIDILWVGARTSANPFATQALADAIGRICPEKPVFVKNPISPDLGLWIGALARLSGQGVRYLGAIHRGFSVYKTNPYRNSPIWQIPLELHRRMPELPILHDPSHTGGQREHIVTLSQQAMDMGFAGLMIEAHPNPEKALSDGGQQITPQELATLYNALKIRAGSGEGETLEQLRCQIDEIDNELLSILARRMDVSRKIGEYKRQEDMPVVQPERYNRLLTALLERGCRLGLDETFLTRLLETVHAESVRCQLDLLNPHH